MLGSVVSCLQCGSLVKLNATIINADWPKITLSSGPLQPKTQDTDEFGLPDFGKYPIDLQTSLGNQALVMKERGELQQALTLFKEQESICRKNHFMDWLQWSLGNQASILEIWGDKAGAERLREQAIHLSLQENSH